MSYQEAIIIDSSHAGPHFNLGRVFEQLGERDNAILSYKNATKSKGNYTMAYVTAILFQQRGWLNNASINLKKTLVLNPQWISLQYDRCNL